MIALVLSVPLVSGAETCTSVGSFAWTTEDGSAGEAWAGCTPDAGDEFVIAPGSTVTVPAGTKLGSDALPLAARILVQGRLDVEGNTTLVHRDLVSFADGSDGVWNGHELATAPLPIDIRFPSSTTIAITWPGVPPWPLCDVGCDELTVHPGDGTVPPTLFYFDFDKLEGSRKTAVFEAEYDFTDPVGMFLEVIGVSDDSGDAIFDTVTLALPTLGPDAGDLWFGASGGPVGRTTPDGGGRCNECLDDGSGAPAGDVSNVGARFRNDVAAVDLVDEWVLRDGSDPPWAKVENDNGQVRFEIYLDPTRQPFDTDREFDGYLVCRPADQATFDPASEDWCARVVRSLADHHDGSGETLVVWKDPGPLRKNEVLNVYYARPTQGDRVTPVNPIRFVGQGAGSLRVASGSLFGRTNAVHGVWWSNPGPSGSTGLAAASFENGFGLTIDLVLIEHQGDGLFRPMLAQGLLVTSESGSGAELLFEDVAVSRYHYRWPNVNTDVQSGVFSPNGISLEAEHWADTVPGNTLDVWKNVTLRKIRVEGTASSVSANKMGLTIDCADDLMIQDMALLHARSVFDQNEVQAQDMIEYSGSGPRCGTDRAVGMMSISGVTFQVRCRDCPPGTLSYYTSMVDLGEPEYAIPNRGGIAFDQSGRDKIVYANFASASWISGSGGRAVYGLRLGHYAAGGYGDWPGWAACQSTVGLWQQGSSASATTGDCSGVNPPEGAIHYEDNTWVNVRSNGTNRLYMNTADPPAVPIVFRNLLYQVAPDTTGGAVLLYLDAATAAPLAGLVLDDIQVIRSNPAASIPERNFITIEAGTVADGQLQVGPNIWGVGSGFSVRCNEAGPDGPGGAPFASVTTCNVNDTQAVGGDGMATTGWQSTTLPYVTLTGDPNIRIESWDEAWAPQVQACGGACDLDEALPRWSGLVSYDWPHAWATLDPLPGFQRTNPRLEWLPGHLAQRSGFASQIAANDSVPAAGPGTVQPEYAAGERLASWLSVPVDGTLVAVEVAWRSASGAQPDSTETAIELRSAGTFPTPGVLRAQISSPVLVDGGSNEFDAVDPGSTPLALPVAAGELIVVSLELASAQVGDPSAPSVLVDDDGCQAGSNALYDLPAGSWVDACTAGASGDFAIRLKITPDAAPAYCGNSFAEAGEQCDDGNPFDLDGCSSTCQLEPAIHVPSLGAVGLFLLASALALFGATVLGRRQRGAAR